MTIQNTLDSLRDSGRDATLPEAAAMAGAARDGTLHHIEGGLIGALVDLADEGTATVGPAFIWRGPNLWFIQSGGYAREENDALQAVIAAQEGPTRFGQVRPGWTKI